MSRRDTWINAANALSENPYSQVICPDCGVSFLTVQDQRIDITHIDRHIQCSNCGAHEVIFKREPLDNSGEAEET